MTADGKARVYMAGPIIDVDGYRVAFEEAKDALAAEGYIVLNPACHPRGLTNAEYLLLSIPMLALADVVYFLPNWTTSAGMTLERRICEYIQKPYCWNVADIKELI